MKKTSEKPINKGGRPKKHIELSPLKFKASKPKKMLDMSDRKSVEKYCENKVHELETEYDSMYASIMIVVNALQKVIEAQSAGGVLPESLIDKLEKHQERARKVLKDRADMLQNFMKQFELFSTLDRPADEDPLYTPVHLNIVTVPPPEAIIPNKFELDEDEIEPPTEDNQLA